MYFLCFAQEERKFWIKYLLEISTPVISNLDNQTLRDNMPVEVTAEGAKLNREKVTHLEALGRTICGIAPWLELGPDETEEGRLRAQYIRMTQNALRNAVDSVSADFLLFNEDRQALVDAAFLAQGILRAPNQLWVNLDDKTKNLLNASFEATRVFKPQESNWLLFSAMIEAFFYKMNGTCDLKVIDYALSRFDEWYKGDGWYGDGTDFHLDYYNSFVIHPMLFDVLSIMKDKSSYYEDFYEKEKIRLVRFAIQQERMISPEGTYPVIGRSVPYRFGAFHALSQAAYLKILAFDIAPQQVR
ncbi:MAG: DUF2264 domain-containing protein, partial [Bacteroidales bacterium]